MRKLKNRILAFSFGLMISSCLVFAGLETGTYISDLNSANPTNSDLASTADDHLRLIKSTIKTTFPNISGVVIPTHTELNYVDGVTSAIQTQLDTKLASSSYTASDVLSKLTTVDGSGSGVDADLLDGISSGGFCQTGGSGCPNAATIGGWTSSNDGSGSGLDADLLDGQSSAFYQSASNLNSGTLPDARFPATLPTASGTNLTALNATQLTSGTVPDARFPSTLPAASGTNLTSLNASNLSSGTVAAARLPFQVVSFRGFDNGSTCTNSASYNVSSCARDGTGLVTVSFSVTYSSAPVCTTAVSDINNANDQANVKSVLTTSVQIQTRLSNGTATALGFHVICLL